MSLSKTQHVSFGLGKGIFTTKDFIKGDFLVEYKGMSQKFGIKMTLTETTMTMTNDTTMTKQLLHNFCKIELQC